MKRKQELYKWDNLHEAHFDILLTILKIAQVKEKMDLADEAIKPHYEAMLKMLERMNFYSASKAADPDEGILSRKLNTQPLPEIALAIAILNIASTLRHKFGDRKRSVALMEALLSLKQKLRDLFPDQKPILDVITFTILTAEFHKECNDSKKAHEYSEKAVLLCVSFRSMEIQQPFNGFGLKQIKNHQRKKPI